MRTKPDRPAHAGAPRHRSRPGRGGRRSLQRAPQRTVEDFQRESAACIEDAKGSPYGPSGLEPVYRACMRGQGWKRVEVSVADNYQFRGPEDDADFLRLPSPMSGKRYYQNR